MAESAASEAREARSKHLALKELLKNTNNNPWDKNVEFQRKTLRRHYLKLLLIFPYAQESKDCETHLWMQTSYAFITSYKHRITSLERIIQTGPNDSGPPAHGPVEHRKLIQRFRQFLAEEEKFWTKLILRIYRSFRLVEAKQSLAELGLLSTEGGMSEATARDGEGSTRDPHQFPLEDPRPPTPSTEQRPARLAILSKALISLGDIARYREQYNESGGRPKAGHDDSVPSKRGRHRRGGSVALDSIPRPRNYDKAQRCYERARFLLPSEGNPSHQLAIIASYKKEVLLSILHYHRSLCVKQPYETASDNLDTVLTKALETYKARIKSGNDENNDLDTPDQSIPPRVRIESFKEKIVALHAVWRIGGDRMDSIAKDLAERVGSEFHALVSERHLPLDLISNIIVLTQAALWNQRMLRDSNRRSANSSGAESRIFSHLLALHRNLLLVGQDQLKVPPPPDVQEQDLGQRITAVLRRTLPALRISSKWLRANLQYIVKWPEVNLQRTKPADPQKRDAKAAKRQAELRDFWQAYSEFTRALSRAFPVSRLPSMKGPLDEDVDMRGFLPLKGLMDSETMGGQTASGSPEIQEQVHPNDLELMRISDLVHDAHELVKLENSPLAIYGGHFILKGVEADQVPDFMSGMIQGQLHEDLASHTDDDVVRIAFSFLDDPTIGGIHEDDDDEVVIYPRGEQQTPQTPRVVPDQDSPLNSPVRISTAASPGHPGPSPPAKSGATALDLLDNIMGSGEKTVSSPVVSSPRVSHSSPGPMAPLGSSPLGSSIWNPSIDESSLAFSAQHSIHPLQMNNAVTFHPSGPWRSAPLPPFSTSVGPLRPHEPYSTASMGLAVAAHNQQESFYHSSHGTQLSPYESLSPAGSQGLPYHSPSGPSAPTYPIMDQLSTSLPDPHGKAGLQEDPFHPSVRVWSNGG